MQDPLSVDVEGDMRMSSRTNRLGELKLLADDEYATERSEDETQEPETHQSEVTHIGFLKVHKAASSTLQNMFYRFGLKRNLSFVLPKQGHYLAKFKYKYQPVLPTLRNDSGKFDILANHVRFNLAKFEDFLHDDAVYIAIVRDPFDLFESAAFYFKFVWNFDYLNSLDTDTFMHDLIVAPEKYEAKPIGYSYTFNSMASDFGYEMESIKDVMSTTDEQIDDFVHHLGCVFQYVMITERFEESLVMLKRTLNWQLKDVLFLDLNRYSEPGNKSKKGNTTVEDKRLFRIRNRLDYKIYEYFLDKFNKRIKQEAGIMEEVEHYKLTVAVMYEFCTAKHNPFDELHVNASEWNTPFQVSVEDCGLMSTPELNMVVKMKARHNVLLRSEKQQ